ncbi:MAG TPA: hypothetical protein PLJ27_05530 [Polyangiaceae bacterium]|nr:hypothetical protein [Polyangiaceae bacterium]HNZ22130.1 hypothetical protein [Polyangiaceae bacterium]HOE46954.1 hypothetical protein [Polyangiaceae bacterium]HOG99799.1 hypothetical protein [Polyangiaceae bacterium]HOR33659.1 hypothetical protein [Polyangiaceae bacterium]
MKRLWLVGGLSLSLCGCGHPPRPTALSAADQAARSPTVQDAAPLAPQLLAHAEGLRTQAQASYERGEIASAGLLAERAMVAYERAAVMARLIRAEKLAAQAQNDLSDTTQKQQPLEAERQRLEADIAAIEQLILVVRDAPPITPSGTTDPSRELARLTAARSIIVDARLLCSAAQLLDPPMEGLSPATAEVTRLEQLLAQWPRPAPVDETMRARTTCLSLLTLARTAHPSTLATDVVLAELSENPDLQPSRDDRGIAITIKDDPQTNPSTKANVQRIAIISKKYKDFPILLVSHTRAKAPVAVQTTMRNRMQTIADTLAAEGIDRSRIVQIEAGSNRPIAHDPLPPPVPSQNDRVEIVLVSPCL